MEDALAQGCMDLTSLMVDGQARGLRDRASQRSLGNPDICVYFSRALPTPAARSFGLMKSCNPMTWMVQRAGVTVTVSLDYLKR